jgi:asparagine synthase (glutamine-hydrolysing)
MCGIFADINSQTSDLILNESYFESLKRRGPDNFGHFEDSMNNYFFQTRLAVIDLNEEANQPFHKNGNFIIFNGEIYNFKELRANLEIDGVHFITASDTEVLLEGILKYGVDFLHQIRGMFAFILFDKSRQEFFGARDRFGEKPLYYSQTGNRLIFASDFQTVFRARKKPLVFNYEAFNLYLHYQFIPEPQTLDLEIRKVEAGSYFKCDVQGNNLHFEKYFELTSVGKSPEPYEENEIVLKMLELLKVAVERTLESDVPIALSLSAGIDSGAIAVLTRELNPNQEIHAFTLGYKDHPEIDERIGATKLAKLLSINLHSIEVDTSDFIRDFPIIVDAMDEPIADPAAYSHFLIPLQANAKGFKVLLNGIGGDEFNWGYWWLETAVSENRKRAKGSPCKIFRFLFQKEQKPSDGNLYFYQCLEEFNSVYTLKEKLFEGLKSSSKLEQSIVGKIPKDFDSVGISVQNALITSWMVSNCLNLADRVGMYNSVETRMPFLDADLTNYLIELTARNISTDLGPKYLLKKSLSGILPKFVLNREKTGFRIPNTPWMEGLIEKYGDNIINGSLAKYVQLNRKEVISLILKKKKNWYELFILYKIIIANEWLENLEEVSFG